MDDEIQELRKRNVGLALQPARSFSFHLMWIVMFIGQNAQHRCYVFDVSLSLLTDEDGFFFA